MEATSTSNDAALLRIENLRVTFGSTVAVEGVSLCVHERQIVAVVGESGCGKSVTALSVLNLISKPGAITGGAIWFDGENLVQRSRSEMLRIRGRDIAMIFQEPMSSLNPVFTIGDQIIEAILLHQNVNHRQAREVACQSLADVGLANPRRQLRAYPHQFSGGMRQRVMIAMALACQPKLLLADEPTTALDVTIQAQILDLLHELQEPRGMGILFITHDLGLVAQHADVVCVMYAGRVIECASVFELFDHPTHPYTAALLRCRPSMTGRVRRLLTVSEAMSKAERATISVDGKAFKPWWPQPGIPRQNSHLAEISPGHFVACEGDAADAVTQLPNLRFRRDRSAQYQAGEATGGRLASSRR